MNTNTSVATLGSLNGNARISKAGNFLGNRFDLCGEHGNVADIKAEILKANPNLKGKALKAAIVKVRRGDMPMAWVAADLAIAALRAKGAVPTILDSNKTDTKFAMKFEMLPEACPTTPEEKRAAAVDTLKAMSEEERLAALGYSAEQIKTFMSLK